MKKKKKRIKKGYHPRPSVKDKKKKKKKKCVGESKRSDRGSHVCVFIYQNAMET